ncbi:UDP-3-O-acyl-N-acetylglucosamine deacetylase [Octadecabacter sp. 1_MG-2023]|uniref:UDP-3-O-acyl-N-acetylglucosamine deacetylase n=1 Tax=unclassified Octadecabacter TaxID=196158 RepID=UPI001C08787F|nr:UDP-3-O-acyl-N-acetylglucosamine deacetylase [Octadecabacter sp. 1_MG-2023]MBU2992941.1 UDP-3-O-acyl-N-acetylglucosamine deacetylase [Octadecabacter sp. B2R22]MDO6733608.1 UDP-3-O-acyl-N-acetylglucosamine deacetylase [Octadecabacter sp. 1_MG-2023]
MQTTVDSIVAFEGKGLHLGEPVSVVVRPAPADYGIVFRRTDVDVADADVPALWNNVIVSPLNTRIQNAAGTSVSTIEHIMAALAGCGLHNVLIEVSGPEVPILDGSAAEFVEGFLRAGVRTLSAPLRVIEILKPVTVKVGDAVARLDPSDTLHIRFEIDFADRAIGHQTKTLNMANGAFVRELCDSRTFCRSSDVDAMRAQGLALGGTLENAVVVDGADVLSPGGLRHSDEAVRHKMLDALGDLYTAGAPILGLYTGSKAGHAVTNALLCALFEDPDAWGWADVDARTAARLPGVGLRWSDLPDVA